MTYRQAHELGGQVRKGEKGNLVVHAGTFTPKDGETGEPITNSEGEETSRAYLKRYVVFNVEQIDGLDMSKFPAPQIEIKNRDDRDPELDAAFSRWPVPYRESGNSAYYHPVADSITMPAFAEFVSGNAFYATLAHEAIHSTGHTTRLNRETLYEYGKSKEIRVKLSPASSRQSRSRAAPLRRSTGSWYPASPRRPPAPAAPRCASSRVRHVRGYRPAPCRG